MKKRIRLKRLAGILILCCAMIIPVLPCKADNPIVQNIYTADPAPMVSGDTLYVYTGHDEDKLVSNFYTMNEWKCYSTKDMVNWTDHGTVLSLNTFSWAKDRAWAPHCIERNGKFYLYAPIHRKNGGMVIGVAVSNSPTGPFEDALGKPLVDIGDWFTFDPTVYIDDDGQAYMYFGNPQLRYVKLNEDMISYDKTVGKNGIVDVEMNESGFGEKVETSSEKRSCSYGEAPWFYKRSNLYYMVYAGFAPNGGSEHLAYSTSKSPTGPWEYRGIFMPTQGGCYTNHPGIVDFMGHSYLFYHNQKLTGGGSYHRSVAVEEFKYNKDGTIPTINMTTAGTDAIASLNPYQWTEAETFAWGTNIKVEGSKDEGINLCDIKNGSSIKIKNVDFGEKGAVSFRAAIASECGGSVELHLDSATGPNIGTLNFDQTDGVYSFKIFRTDVTNTKGVHDLFMVFKGESTDTIAKFDHWRFVDGEDTGAIPDPTPKPTPKPTPTPTPTPTPRPTRSPKPTAEPSPGTTPISTATQNPTTMTNVPTASPLPTPRVEKDDVVKVSKVKGVSVKVTKTRKAKIKWKKVSGAAGYNILCSTSKNFKKGVKKKNCKKTSYTTKKLKKGKKYFIKIRAYKLNHKKTKVYGKFSTTKKIRIK